jgi:hypothetical protein
MAWQWNNNEMAWKGMEMARHGNFMEWYGLERHGNGMETTMTCHGITWKGMKMAWKGMEWKCHGINRFVGLVLVGSFVSLYDLTQKLGRSVQ